MRDLHPAAVILDVGLPFRPGTDLLSELKADSATADVPVVLVSGLVESVSEERQAMATAVLPKPFEVDRLVDIVRNATAGHEGTGAA